MTPEPLTESPLVRNSQLKSKFRKVTIPPVNSPTFACKSGGKEKWRMFYRNMERWLDGKCEGQKEDALLPKAMLPPGASGFMMPGIVLFSQHPTIATAPRCESSGGQRSLRPRTGIPWTLSPFGPGKGLCSYCWDPAEPLLVASSSLSSRFQSGRAGQLSSLSQAWAASNHSMVASCSHHQDQRLGPPVFTHTDRLRFPFMHLSPRWSSYSTPAHQHIWQDQHPQGPARRVRLYSHPWAWAEVGTASRGSGISRSEGRMNERKPPPVHGRAARADAQGKGAEWDSRPSRARPTALSGVWSQFWLS